MEEIAVEEIVIAESLDVFAQVNLFPRTAPIPYELTLAFLRLKVTPVVLQLLESLIVENRIDGTEALIEYGLRLQDEWDLYAAALCLRTGSSPNIYLHTEEGSIHLLAAVIRNLTANLGTITQDSLLWRFLALLKLHELDVELPLLSEGIFPETQTLREWLGVEAAVYDLVPGTLEQTNVNDRFYYAALSGLTENLEIQKINETQYKFLLKSRTYALMRKKVTLERIISNVELDSILSVLALEYCNTTALVDYVRDVALISYPLTNELCLRCRDRGVLGVLWAEALLLCVSYGLPLDLFQYSMIKDNEVLVKQLTEVYAQPYWSKYLSSQKKRGWLPNRVYRLAVAICGKKFDSDLKRVREAIAAIQNESTEEIEQALTRRERLKIIAERGCLQVGQAFDCNQEVAVIPVFSEVPTQENGETLPENYPEPIAARSASNLRSGNGELLPENYPELATVSSANGLQSENDSESTAVRSASSFARRNNTELGSAATRSASNLRSATTRSRNSASSSPPLPESYSEVTSRSSKSSSATTLTSRGSNNGVSTTQSRSGVRPTSTSTPKSGSQSVTNTRRNISTSPRVSSISTQFNLKSDADLAQSENLVANPYILLSEYRILFNNDAKLYILYSSDYRRIESAAAFQTLPEFEQQRILQKIEHNLAKIRESGSSPLTPRTYLDVIVQELEEDKISNRETELELARFYVALGVIPPPEMVLQLYAGIYNLQALTLEHARVTLAYIYNHSPSEEFASILEQSVAELL